MYLSDVYIVESHDADTCTRQHDILYFHDRSRYTITNMFSPLHRSTIPTTHLVLGHLYHLNVLAYTLSFYALYTSTITDKQQYV